MAEFTERHDPRCMTITSTEFPDVCDCSTLAMVDVLAGHVPILGSSTGAVVGCRCMDRVFVRGQEAWPKHVAEALGTAGLLPPEPGGSAS